MKKYNKIVKIAGVLAVMLLTTAIALADKPIKVDSVGTEVSWQNSGATTIQSGQLVGSDGVTLTVGFNTWGYNYQAHLFNGGYCDAYRNAAWCQAYKDDELIMKWNDAWLANTDADGDTLLDRHYGYTSYIGSGAWVTNHQKGSYVGGDGQTCNWEYSVKIIAAPTDATNLDGKWYAADGTEIGAVIWGEFAIIQEVNNDPCAGYHGNQYNSPYNSGLGGW